MNRLRWLTLLTAGLAALAAAQDNPQPQRVTVQLRDPAAAHKLEVNLTMANVTVRGTDRRDVEIDYTARGQTARRAAEPPPPGMHRIGGSGGLDVTQDNNTVRVGGGSVLAGINDVTIQVPVQTAVAVVANLGGKIVVENVSGEVEVNNFNGEITITNVSGPVVASSTNGKIVAELSRLTADKSMSFSTFNGDIDVTLPADAKATLKATADNGDIWTDFDVKLEPLTIAPTPPTPAPPAAPAPPAPPASLSSQEERARQFFSLEQRAMQSEKRLKERQKAAGKRKGGGGGDGYVEGTINGGGTEIQFTTFNGRILIHKK